MSPEWVDFKTVKQAVTMPMVLDHYGVSSLRKSGDELRGPCPVHKGSAKSFSVNIQKSAFKCFSKDCGARGNVLDFVAAMEHCDVRSAALKLQAWFKIGDSEPESPEHDENNDQAIEVQRGIYKDKNGRLYEVLFNASSAEDCEPLVVYRELFGDYQFWVAPLQKFGIEDSYLTLVREL